MQVKKKNGFFRNDLTPLCYPTYTPETSCLTVAARTYVKENAEKEKKKSGWINPDSIGIQMRHPEKREKKKFTL